MSEPSGPWNGTPITSSGLRSPSTSPEASDQPAWSLGVAVDAEAVGAERAERDGAVGASCP